MPLNRSSASIRKFIAQRTAGPTTLVLMVVSLYCPSAAFADIITLGSAQSFAVLGGAGVTVGGACCTVVSGNLGDFPLGLSSITGFPTPSSLVNGSFYASDQLSAIAQQAQADENIAYNALAGLPSTANETGFILGSGGAVSTLFPGVYMFSSVAQVNGALTLDFDGQSDAAFVFQIASTLTTGIGAIINVIGANASDAIYWQVGDAATLGSGTAFAGDILALNAITLSSGASIACGRAFALTASVTMAATNFISTNCSQYNTLTGYSSSGPTDFGSNGFSGSSEAGSTPEPGTLPLLGIGLAVILGRFSVRKR